MVKLYYMKEVLIEDVRFVGASSQRADVHCGRHVQAGLRAVR